MRLDALCLDHTLACIPQMETVVRKNRWGRFYKVNRHARRQTAALGSTWCACFLNSDVALRVDFYDVPVTAAACMQML